MPDAGAVGPVEALLRARSVAVVGASPKRDAFGFHVLRQLRDCGFAGDVFAVNPRYGEIDGMPCAPDLASLPPVDCAVLALADARLEATLEAAAAAGARSAVIFGAAFGQARDGTATLAERLGDIATSAGMALCGPNGMGFFNLVDRLLVSGFPLGREPVAGHAALISHSGSVFSAFAKNRRDIRFNYVVSGGQEAATTAADYLRFLVEQPETRVVGCFLETIRDPAGFVAALAAAERRDVAVVALKVGRSERGRELALAHSGALAGADAAYRAFFDRHGVIQVRTLDEMLDVLELLSSERRPATRAVAIGCDSGGERAMLVDLAGEAGVTLAALGPETTGVLAETLDPGLVPVNPVDLWGTGHDHERVFETCLKAVSDDPAVGMTVFAVDLTHASRLTPGYVDVAKRVAATTRKPLVVLGNVAAAMDEAAMASLRAAGVPVLMGTANGLAAIAGAIDGTFRARADGPNSAVAVDRERRDRWRRVLRDSGGAPLPDAVGKAMLRDYGLPATEPAVVESVDEAVQAAEAIGFPVVLKTAMPGVLHKSDVGGVVLDLGSAEAVRAGYERLAGALGPAVAVESRVDGAEAIELYLGMISDSTFGPVVTVGAGGILVEALGDTVSILPPVSTARATAALRRLRVARLLAGVRGRPPVDEDAVVEAVVRFGALCVELAGALAAVDVNPLLAGPAGVIAVDALVIPAGATSARDPTTAGD